MSVFLKINIIIFILYFVPSVWMSQAVYFISKVNNWNDRPNNIEVTPLKNKHYFRRFNNEWKRNKCESLGFKFNESFFRSYDHDTILNNSILILLTTPLQNYSNCFVDQDNNCVFKALSLAICGNISYFQKIRGKVIDNIKNSIELKNFLGGKRRFNNYTLFKTDGDFVGDYGSVIEVLATAEYLDVCIYVYEDECNQWIIYRKDWPNYESIDMKTENCIYLNLYKQSFRIVTAVNTYI
ncbi:uncharacterized protein LOC126896613 [Daktulosphaira vitifoliae]|uniref:uncharacterized protein LOC126896613 n=1 Tax=Daktulosphaira vitifoliae TaxID=58002 RepID=UPI0021AACE54|nr:uncharacterized protein LOC126896613 [Daktulosphaira vitifoliae]